MGKKRLTTEEFISRAKEVHGDKYDYSKVEYGKNRKTKVCIICHEKDEKCEEHGEFWQTPNNHLYGKGCPKCASNYRYKSEEIIEEFKKIHGDKYDYSKVVYKDAHTKVCIICLKHGEFWMTPNLHLRGSGCKKCYKEIKGKDRYSNTEEFIEKARKVHGDKYDYSKVEYKCSNKKVRIICPIHGEYWQTPNSHLMGRSCPKCGGKDKTTEDVINAFKLVHKDKYNYSKVVYKGMHTKVCIICPIHGEYWQTPANHLQGQGCSICKESRLERSIRNILEENKIEYEYQKRFIWLGKQSLDFYLPKYNIAIECQGKQHYEPVDFAGNGKDWAEKLFEKNKKRDKTKFKKIKMHNIKMMYVNEENKNNFLKTLKNEII